MQITTVSHPQQMQQYCAQVWQLLVASYARVNGGLNYASAEQLMATSACWKLALDGDRVLAVTIYKAKKGLKLVAMAVCSQYRDLARSALIRIIKTDLHRCWMELSEQAELFVLKHCGGHRFLIHSSLVVQLLDQQIESAELGGFHYRRTIQGHSKLKIALGTPSFMPSQVVA